jgi:integrase
MGEGRAIEQVTRADCAAVHELIAGMPANVHKRKAYDGCRTLGEIVKLATERGADGAGTLRVYAHALSSFFNWGIRKGIVTSNPATRLAEARGPANVSRRPFRTDELNRLICGLRGWARTGGNEVGGRFWVPLIAIYSGMRLGEIVSLTVDDVDDRDGARCFVLRRVEGRSLKTQGAERVVPIHPELIGLGLDDLITAVRQRKGLRLFPICRAEISGRSQTFFRSGSATGSQRCSTSMRPVSRSTPSVMGSEMHCARPECRLMQRGHLEAGREAVASRNDMGRERDHRPWHGGWQRSNIPD